MLHVVCVVKNVPFASLFCVYIERSSRRRIDLVDFHLFLTMLCQSLVLVVSVVMISLFQHEFLENLVINCFIAIFVTITKLYLYIHICVYICICMYVYI